ncbi:hypothetical protein CORC01_00820 [Colletotrichum orchidophilum]|uniref:Heterokaryon incompatibility domain-containing protein n=1 Tax=Colletotrichum orchidophilum TaxID=1209926 RepID=A0A1G4BRF7_9PEZI|nr:uncharacterized protein CORC01_00820 [Colletotrichum orchidophilum]OHF03958.1 hypothetical protein CORC01_00820 [Colletotrichum orchidophilum]
MRLLHTSRLEVESFPSDVPIHAVLSYTWDDEEVTLQDLEQKDVAVGLKGFAKLSKSCEAAAAAGFEYLWIDTCCIDKTSGTELSEAINSMYRWYRESAICYVFLPDVSQCDKDSVSTSFLKPDTIRWFTRGWTLQELLAPDNVEFFDKDWQWIGSKGDFAAEISATTGIPRHILLDPEQFSTVPVCQRMQWAASRVTTRPEDAIYSLLGLFDVNIPLLYGEGRSKAFKRLQEETVKSIEDPSIFLWTLSGDKLPEDPSEVFGGLLADDLSYFAKLDFPSEVTRTLSQDRGPHFMPLQDTAIVFTSVGARVKLSYIPVPGDSSDTLFFVPMARAAGFTAGILMQRISLEKPLFSRIVCHRTFWIGSEGTQEFIPNQVDSFPHYKSPSSKLILDRTRKVAANRIYITRFHLTPESSLFTTAEFGLSLAAGIRPQSEGREKFHLVVLENSLGFQKERVSDNIVQKGHLGQGFPESQPIPTIDWAAPLRQDVANPQGLLNTRASRDCGALGVLKLAFGYYQHTTINTGWGLSTETKLKILGTFCLVVGLEVKPRTLLGTPSAFMTPCVGITRDDDIREAIASFNYEDLGNTLWFHDHRVTGEAPNYFRSSKKIKIRCCLNQIKRLSGAWYDIDLSWSCGC